MKSVYAGLERRTGHRIAYFVDAETNDANGGYLPISVLHIPQLKQSGLRLQNISNLYILNSRFSRFLLWTLIFAVLLFYQILLSHNHGRFLQRVGDLTFPLRLHCFGRFRSRQVVQGEFATHHLSYRFS